MGLSKAVSALPKDLQTHTLEQKSSVHTGEILLEPYVSGAAGRSSTKHGKISLPNFRTVEPSSYGAKSFADKVGFG